MKGHREADTAGSEGMLLGSLKVCLVGVKWRFFILCWYCSNENGAKFFVGLKLNGEMRIGKPRHVPY